MKTMLFNPYSGKPRHPSDIASDPAGILIIDPDEPLRAALAAQAAAPRGTDAQILKERELTALAIEGAMAYGYQNGEYPPEDAAWLRPFWTMGRRDAEREAVIAAQAGQSEPVAWFEHNPDLDAWFLAYSQNPKVKTRPLFDHPAPVRQPLNRAQIEKIVIEVCDAIYPQDDTSYSEADSVFYGAFTHAVEAAHGITAQKGLT